MSDLMKQDLVCPECDRHWTIRSEQAVAVCKYGKCIACMAAAKERFDVDALHVFDCGCGVMTREEVIKGDQQLYDAVSDLSAPPAVLPDGWSFMAIDPVDAMLLKLQEDINVAMTIPSIPPEILKDHKPSNYDSAAHQMNRSSSPNRYSDIWSTCRYHEDETRSYHWFKNGLRESSACGIFMDNGNGDRKRGIPSVDNVCEVCRRKWDTMNRSYISTEKEREALQTAERMGVTVDATAPRHLQGKSITEFMMEVESEIIKMWEQISDPESQEFLVAAKSLTQGIGDVLRAFKAEYDA